MKHIHIPTFFVFGVSIFCISEEHFDMANAIQYCWTGAFVILFLTYYFAMICSGKCMQLPKDRMMKTVCVLGILEVIYAVLQLFGLVPDNFRYAYFSGSLNNPAIFGMFLSFCMPVCVYYAVKSVGREQTLWEVAAMIFGVFVVLSNSRTAILASVCGIAVILLMEMKSLHRFICNRRYRTIGMVGLVIVFTALYFYKQDSADGRVLIWTVCLEMVKDRPWLGWGFDGYIAQYMNYQADYLTAHPDSPFVMLAGETQSPFNEFLHAALVYGIPCALLLVGILLWTIWYIYKRVKEYKSILLGLVFVLIIWCLFSYPFNIPFVWLIILFVGLSMVDDTSNVPFRKFCMVSVIMIGAVGMYSLYVAGSRDIRRLILQERAMEDADDEVMEEYEKMYKDYSDDYMFIYNYGALLHLRGEYEKSLEVFEAGTDYLSDYNMMLLMGDDYQKLKRYDLAIVCYRRAGEMIPSRYLPLYYQMKLYIEKADTVNVHEIANMILNKENKIKKSKITRQIINEAKECLDY